MSSDSFSILLAEATVWLEDANSPTSECPSLGRGLELTHLLAEKCLIPSFKDHEDHPYDCDEFSVYIERTRSALPVLSSLIAAQSARECRPSLKELQSVLLLCFEHLSKSPESPELSSKSVENPSKVCLWSTGMNSLNAESLLLQISRLHECKQVQELLIMNDYSTFRLLASTCSVCFHQKNENQFKNNPSKMETLKNLLFSIRSPHLYGIVHIFLPILLKFIDDFDSSLKQVGIRCFNYILQQIGIAELQRNNYHLVIYDVLIKQLVHRNPLLLESLLNCLFDLLPFLEKPPKLVLTAKRRRWSRHDELFEKVLMEMELEDQLHIRRVYCSFSVRLIDLLGVTVLKHSKLFVTVICSYLRFPDEKEICRLRAIEALERALSYAWPFVRPLLHGTMEDLLKLIYDLSTKKDADSSERQLLQSSLQCLLKFNQLQRETVTRILIQLKANINDDSFLAAIEAICSDSLQ